MTPPSNDSTVRGFHHVALRARDFEASHGFYTTILGFTQKIAWGEKPKRAAMLDAGDGNYIELFERPDQPPPADAPQPAILHFALRTDDCDEALKRARDAGMEVTMEPKDIEIDTTAGPHPVPIRIAFFKGPDGEVVELFQNTLT